MRELGIADRLATLWIQQEPDRAAKAVEYVEDKRRKNQIKGNVGGYLRTVFENGTSLDVEVVPRGKIGGVVAAEGGAALGDGLAEKRAAVTAAAIKALSVDERRTLLTEFVEHGGRASSYVESTATFRNALERAAFTAWLAVKIGATIT